MMLCQYRRTLKKALAFLLIEYGTRFTNDDLSPFLIQTEEKI
jgi:hypothetical protein